MPVRFRPRAPKLEEIMEERIMKIALKLSEIRLQLYRIQAEGDNHSSSIAKKNRKNSF